jgi:high-affinity Fe2+/Pb2+ permease
MNEQPMNVRDTLREIGIRAGVLAVGGLVIGGLVTATALKTAGTLVQVAAGATLLLAAAGFASYEARQLRRRIA